MIFVKYFDPGYFMNLLDRSLRQGGRFTEFDFSNGIFDKTFINTHQDYFSQISSYKNRCHKGFYRERLRLFSHVLDIIDTEVGRRDKKQKLRSTTFRNQCSNTGQVCPNKLLPYVSVGTQPDQISVMLCVTTIFYSQKR